MSKRKDYIWNTAAGVINAAEVIVMSMIVTRYGRLSDAGILSYAFAVANVLMAIGSFGGRMFQATDINSRFTFRMYLLHRFFALGLMALSLVGILVLGAYGREKTESIILVSLIYMVEVIENCIWGHYQSCDRLYIGAQMFCTRWIAILFTFIVCMIALKDMTSSLFWGSITGTVVFLIWIVVLHFFGEETKHPESDAKKNYDKNNWFWDLLKQTFPLFLAGFCSLSINNIPKFAIEKYLNDEIQACYGFVAMPVFVIGLLNQFIYQPLVAKMTREYQAGNLVMFRKDVKKQMINVSGILVLCVIGAALIGIPVLSVIYHTDLKEYWLELIILQFAGGFLALTGFFNVVLTIMRNQSIILWGYAGATVLGVAVMFICVRCAGTIGASVAYLAVNALLFVFFYSSYKRKTV